MFTCNVFCILTLKLAGMNGYYLQFMLPLTFFERWFTHERNPLIEGRHITEAEAREYKKQMVAAIKKRGLEFHACGHGWTCAPYDLPAGGWEVFEGEIDEETKNDFALVGGKRELWQGIPLNTELCYSKASVRKKVADFCVSYIKENPEIDIILKAWQNTSRADGFSFEYYYWVGEHYADFGSINLANVIYRDIHGLDSMRLSGIVSCQSQRSFMPTGLGSYVMAKSLFDTERSFEEITDEYFIGAYGEYADIFKTHFVKLSELARLERSGEKYNRVKNEAENMKLKIKELADMSDCCHSLSVRYAQYHCDLLIKTAKAEAATVDKGYEGALDKWRELITFVRKTENEVQPVFDVFQYLADLFEIKHTELKKYQL